MLKIESRAVGEALEGKMIYFQQKLHEAVFSEQKQFPGRSFACLFKMAHSNVWLLGTLPVILIVSVKKYIFLACIHHILHRVDV